MSRERELLERVVEYWGIQAYPHDWEKLVREIRAYLAQPTQDEEPLVYIRENEVLYINAMKANNFATEWKSNLGLTKEKGDVGLFLHPAPRQEFVRLSEEEISEMAQKCFIRREAGQYHIPYGTTDFARAIEDALEEMTHLIAIPELIKTTHSKAAAELQRLHEMNQELLTTLIKVEPILSDALSAILKILAERDRGMGYFHAEVDWLVNRQQEIRDLQKQLKAIITKEESCTNTPS